MRDAMSLNHDATALLAAALGHPDPYPFPVRLLERLLNGDIPSQLDVPTRLSRTSEIFVWLLARAQNTAHAAAQAGGTPAFKTRAHWRSKLAERHHWMDAQPRGGVGGGRGE